MKIKFNMIDKELRFRGRLVKFFNNSFTERKLRFLNKLMKKFRIKIKDESMQVIEEWITRKDGSKMRICIFKPLKQVENVPGVLWLHGGGYAIGMPEQAKIIAKMVIEISNCIVVAPDYTLSIQKPYPAALDDCYETLLWMRNQAKTLGIREDQLMVGGDSAGGGLTAALSLYARDNREVNIAFQMPLCPMLDDRMISESVIDNNAPIWNLKSTYNGWKLYLGDLFEKPNVPSYAAPAREMNYNNLPPAVIFVGELDPFRDETIQYVKNLEGAGVPVDFMIFKGCYHGFNKVCPNAEVSKKAMIFVMNSFKNAVEQYFINQPENYDKK